MANATDKSAVFAQALTDAGCGDALKARCCECYACGDIDALKKLLSEQRKALLEQVHNGQKQIDCLDYLAYTIRKKRLGGTNHDRTHEQ